MAQEVFNQHLHLRFMKKPVKIAIGVVVVLVVALVIIGFSIGGIIKTGVETVGPKVTKVSIKLDGVGVMPLSGGGSVKGMVIGNPEGYTSAFAIKVDKASLSISPGSLLSDKIVVKSIQVEGPEITMEGGLKENNLTQILKNIEEFTGGAENKAAEEGKAGSSKKLQVDEFIVKNAKVNVIFKMLGNKPLSVTVPEIKLTNLGTGPEGITPGDLTKRVFEEILGQSTKFVTDAVSQVGKIATDAVKDVGGAASETTKKATEGIKSLFKK